MKTKMKNTMKIFLATLALCTVNTAIVLAQPVEIDVNGGGFIIRGPASLNFLPQPVSLDNPTRAVLNFKDIGGTGPQYLEIGDQNGGSAFNVALGADNLTLNNAGLCTPPLTATPLTYGPTAGNCIPNSYLAIRNNDGASAADQTPPGITTIDGLGSSVSLDTTSTEYKDLATYAQETDPTTDSASLSEQRVLLAGTGAAPGTWRIYPQLQETTPANTGEGNYSGTITITVTAR